MSAPSSLPSSPRAPPGPPRLTRCLLGIGARAVGNSRLMLWLGAPRSGRSTSSQVSEAVTVLKRLWWRVEKRKIARDERRRQSKELTLKPSLNSKTSLDSIPTINQREYRAQQIFFSRLARGKEKTEFMEKALDLRHVGK